MSRPLHISALAVLLILGGAAAVWKEYLSPEAVIPNFRQPQVVVVNGRLEYPMIAPALLAEVGSFDNEFSAFLRFDYIRSRRVLRNVPVFVCVKEEPTGPDYHIYLQLPNNLPQAIEAVSELRSDAIIANYDLLGSTLRRIEEMRQQTEIFVAAYQFPSAAKLDWRDTEDLVSYVARFIAFKSRTDPRVRRRATPGLASLSLNEATELAADVIAVAKFYELPLDLLLGIGAMENNFLNVRGDLEHKVWKRRPEPGDIIVERHRSRVLVSNYSSGIWQITRETLRRTHQLYLADTRDYTMLPERLRPPKTLNLDTLDPHLLTTYAGLLLRNLLDHFAGDVIMAAGAYNGGKDNPNLQYADGVQTIATYAGNLLQKVGRSGTATQYATLREIPVSAGLEQMRDERSSMAAPVARPEKTEGGVDIADR